ncbi:MAG: UPF0182 family protein, partial [Armatimonadetes bacterium]|nr:UPF0182 family protein [Armatimonadota bacterium]
MTRTALILVVVALVLFGGPLVNVYVDLLWFGEVGQQRVWWTILGAQAQLAAIFGLGMALIVYLNVFLARRASPPLTPRLNDFPLRVRVGQLAQRGIAWLLIAGCAVIGALAALWAASYWETYLLFRHAQRFEVADPIFRRDVGFYVFTLPFWRLVYQWLLASLMLSTLAAIGVYVLDRAVEVMQGYMRVAVGVRGHLSALLGLIALTLAWGFYLDRYDLLFNDNGILFGANWTDVNVRRGALVLLMIAALVTAGAFFYNVYYRDLRLPAWTAAFMAVAWFTVGTLYPALQQRFVVQPNELQLERPYLQNHLAATRQAFGLDRMLVRDYPMRGQLSPAALQKEAATLTNVRLWDWRALGQAYQALQSLRGYYDLTEVDVDRYQINGRYRQVMLAARRMDTSRLPDTQWVNRRLTYTHGNGVVMSPVNEVEENGQPIFWLRNLPVQSDVKDLKITRPEIYYSDLGSPPVIALSKAAEFDYPREQAEATSHYEGRGGIPVGGLWRRLLLAIFLGDTNVAISDQIEPRSRLLLRRQIDERLAHVAPFLRFEHDPYLAIAQDGRLYYMLDAYTVTDRYPYSAPYRYFYSRLRTLMDGGLVEDAPGWLNYIRNAVKATVDAYDGTVRLYVADPTDPLIQAYQAIFPGLFHSLAEMPGDLRTHIRYPEDLLNIQARVFRAYHVTNPDTFYKNG